MDSKRGTRSASFFVVTVTLAAALFGCASSLKLTPIKSTENKPSNVAVYFKVETSSGDPVGGLTSESFRIYEDDALVSQYESKQTILNPEVAASHYTLLLIDMSGSISESGNSDRVVDAATAFADRVGKLQKVAVYSFDGSEDIHPVVPFTTGPESAKEGLKALKTYKPQDPSTNLNGAVVKGIDTLDDALAHSEHPMKFGTLVVFTDGTDRAARVSNDVMRKKLRDSQYGIFAIGLGAEIKESELKDVGRDGTAMATDKESVVKAFDTIGARIEAVTKSYYLLSYCSPARAGKHEVRVEAVTKDAQGKESKSGSLRRPFDATGFGAGCDPKTPPTFDTSKGDALAPPPATTSTPPATTSAPPPPNLPPPPPAQPNEVFTP